MVGEASTELRALCLGERHDFALGRDAVPELLHVQDALGGGHLVEGRLDDGSVAPRAKDDETGRATRIPGRYCATVLLLLLQPLAAAAEPNPVEPSAVTDVSCPSDPSAWPAPPIEPETRGHVDGGAQVKTCLNGLQATGRHVAADSAGVCVVPQGGLVVLRAVVGDPGNPSPVG